MDPDTALLHLHHGVGGWGKRFCLQTDSRDEASGMDPNKVPELPITNFSQDWQDGKALGALVDGLAPGKAKFLI